MRRTTGKIVLRMDMEDQLGTTNEFAFVERAVNGEIAEVTVPLGPPILSVSFDDLDNLPLITEILNCLEDWIAIERLNLYNRYLKIPASWEFRTWSPNVRPNGRVISHFASGTGGDNVQDLLSALSPAIGNLVLQAGAQKRVDIYSAARGLVKLLHDNHVLDPTLRDLMLRVGVDPSQEPT